ncbi:unnamed protein product [Symbiodinium sp. KB8]|nr:unnamed protein product [Symbiodinium sp. KB8]
MDDWMMYQLTGEPRYISSHRKKLALRAGLMGGSLGGIGVVCTSMVASQMYNAGDWPPRWLPRRAASVSLAAATVAAGLSWMRSRELVGLFAIPQFDPEEAEDPMVKA